MDTIFAVSSGQPPAAIAVMRISGPRASQAAIRLAGVLPPARTASLRTLRNDAGEVLDRALAIFFPGPHSATGEDIVELHVHGGRAVVAAVGNALGSLDGVRLAQPGEFTRRALENGCLDLIQAEGLADLLQAETEAQRRAALAASEGRISRHLRGWMRRLSEISAMIEVQLDHADEDDVPDFALRELRNHCTTLAGEIDDALAQPGVERLRDGPLIVLAGPPNAGKSSLFNALLDRDAAIVTPIAGTTRDVLEAAVVRNGHVYRLADTAGLNERSDDPVERIGVDRARSLLHGADLVLWLGAPADAPARSLLVHSKADLEPAHSPPVDMNVSAFEPDTIAALWEMISRRVDVLGTSSTMLFHEAQRDALRAVSHHLHGAIVVHDLLLFAEHMRVASGELATLMGVNATEDMLDALFGRFCLGK